MNLTDMVIQYELPIRLGFFFGTLGLMAVWKIVLPLRVLAVSKPLRWSTEYITHTFRDAKYWVWLPEASIRSKQFLVNSLFEVHNT